MRMEASERLILEDILFWMPTWTRAIEGSSRRLALLLALEVRQSSGCRVHHPNLKWGGIFGSAPKFPPARVPFTRCSMPSQAETPPHNSKGRKNSEAPAVISGPSPPTPRSSRLVPLLHIHKGGGGEGGHHVVRLGKRRLQAGRVRCQCLCCSTRAGPEGRGPSKGGWRHARPNHNYKLCVCPGRLESIGQVSADAAASADWERRWQGCQ